MVVNMPAGAESIRVADVGSITKKIGDHVAEDETVMVMETDKSNVEVKSPGAGIISAFAVAEGDTVKIGQHLFTVVPGAATAKAPTPAATPSTPAPPTPTPTAKPVSTPSPTVAPPKAEVAPTPVAAKPVAAKPVAAKPVAAVGAAAAGGGVTRVKMSRMRLKTAERLKDSQNTAAMLTTFNEIDMGNLKDLRAKYKDDFQKKHGVKLGFMSAFCKAAALALQAQPSVNAFIDGSDIVYHDYVNIAVAVAAPKGLVVPVLRNVQDMSFADVERSIAEYGEKAKKGDLAVEDMDGGTFTISNGGVFGSLMGTPIINPPQSAILGMHAIFDRPMAVKGEVVIRPMMYVALTYDHRIIDGREAVTFLKKIKDLLEDPNAMLLE